MAERGRQGTNLGASRHAFPITPDDNNDLVVETAEIILAVGGSLQIKQPGQPGPVTLTLPAGRFAFVVERVYATGTTATGITGVA